MEGFTVFLGILGIVWAILNIILFFKLWGMTNDVAIIKEHLTKSANIQDLNNEEKKQPIKVDSSYKYKIGDIVMHDSYDKEMRIFKIHADGSAICLDNKKGTMVDTFSLAELKLIQEYKG